jgi:hypothetical protein
MLLNLRAGTVEAVAHSVVTPSYDRSHIRIDVVHTGVGGFHRAHQAANIDRADWSPGTPTAAGTPWRSPPMQPTNTLVWPISPCPLNGC